MGKAVLIHLDSFEVKMAAFHRWLLNSILGLVDLAV